MLSIFPFLVKLKSPFDGNRCNIWCMRYNKKEKQIIIDNYEKYGPLYCSKLLNRNERAVQAQASRMGIKKKGHNKHPSMQKINPEQFWNITTPEVAYFLGYFWADGNILYRINKTCNLYAITMEIVSKDAKKIMPILNKMGNWATNTRKRSETWQETTTISTNSKDLFNFLSEQGYSEKSYAEPTKILAKIPENLKPYWWRGYFDGDGGVSFSKANKPRWKSVGFSSTYNYKWLELIKLLNTLNINKYTIYNAISKQNHKSSKFNLYRIKHIEIFVNYLFQSKLGLFRKTKKLKNLLKRFA